MTLRLTIGCDPGQSGALAIVADGVCADFIDMPVLPRKAGGFEVSGAQLAARLRGHIQFHAGAHVHAVLEAVSAMPGQGGSGMFRFGQSDGVLRGVLGALGIGFTEVHPVKWKKYFGLTKPKGQEKVDKDLSRAYALKRFPYLEALLSRKKDSGRAEALLIALWAEETEQAARAA